MDTADLTPGESTALRREERGECQACPIHEYRFHAGRGTGSRRDSTELAEVHERHGEEKIDWRVGLVLRGAVAT